MKYNNNLYSEETEFDLSVEEFFGEDDVWECEYPEDYEFDSSDLIQKLRP